MSKTKAAKIKTAPNAGALKAYFDRVNRIEDDAEAVREAARDLTTEIKSAGYNAKALKRMVKESRRKSDAQLEADLELYRSLLAMPGATYRSVADKVNVPRSTLHRLVPRSDRGTDHDPETGELKPEDGDGRITKTATSEAAPGDGTGTGDLEGAPAPAVATPSVTVTPCWAIANSIVATEAEEAERKRAARQAELERKAREREEARLENARIDADPLTVPPFLKGSAGNRRAA